MFQFTNGLRDSRRAFLAASATSIAGFPLGLSAATAAEPASGRTGLQGSAKSTILFFLCGGASHLDSWDLKPKAPVEYRGPFAPIATSAPGVMLSEHLPLLAKQAHHLALVNSVAGTVNTNDHHAGYYHNLTGHVPDQSFRTLGNNRTPFPDDWPFMGTVVAAKREPHSFLPNAISLPHKPSEAPYTRPGQFAGRLGVEHNPLYLRGSLENPLAFTAPSLQLQKGIDGSRLSARRELRGALDDCRHGLDQFATTQAWSRHQERAMSLLASSNTTQAFDVSREPESVRHR
ncbi:MAG: DUF1501 domain-containing protein [Planctomycetota bacterium]|nr:DUF1501 domain-containing protein [Planctomycetota bacterium]